jgi:DNA-binding NarL/FixJ family response regulator
MPQLSGQETAGSAEERSTVHVVMVDDYRPFLAVASEVIRAAPGFEPAGEFTSGPDAIAALPELEPGLMIVDIHMPGMNGIEVARRAIAILPSVVVVLITALDPADVPADAKQCGAASVVKKEDFSPELLARLWQAHGRPVE